MEKGEKSDNVSGAGSAGAANLPVVEGTVAEGGAGAARLEPNCDAVSETGVLLDSVIHDLRTPLSAMSGWLEVLEAHFGEVDGIVGRALTGLRRGVDSQTQGLNNLSDVLMKQRIDLPVTDDCLLLERMQLALRHLEDGQPPLDSAVSERLAPIRSLDANGSLTCHDAGSSLNDACGTFLQALALAQDDADAPLTLAASADQLVINVPGGSGDPLPIRSLCHGLGRYTARRPEIRAQALWLARATLRRCGLALRMIPGSGGGFSLLLSRAPQA